MLLEVAIKQLAVGWLGLYFVISVWPPKHTLDPCRLIFRDREWVTLTICYGIV